MSQGTNVQSTITFKVGNKSKKIIYNGSTAEANVIVKQFYPTATDKTGDTDFKDKLIIKGAYICIDCTDSTKPITEHGYLAEHINATVHATHAD